MTSYSHEERARARDTIRRLQSLATESRTALQRGLVLPTPAQTAIYGLTGTEDPQAQVNALNTLSERIRQEHLAKLKPLAQDEFNAFCEYIDPDEPPESKWHIFLTDTLQRIEYEPGFERFVLNCPPGHAKPLSIETPILMADGSWKRLGDIVVGDLVISHTGHPRKVTAVHEQGLLNVLSLTTRGGREIITAPDHSFLARLRHGARPSPEMFVEAEKLCPSSGLVMKAAAPIQNTSGRTIREFELAAYFSAFGSRTYHKGRKGDKHYLDAYLITRDEAASRKMQACLRALKTKFTYWFAKTDDLHYIRLETKTSERLAGAFRLEDKAVDRRIPDFVFRGGDAEVIRYIETYVNFEGSFVNRYTHPRLTISFNSRDMAHEFQRLLARFGIPAEYEDRKKTAARLILAPHALQAYLKRFRYTGAHAKRLPAKMRKFEKSRLSRAPFFPLDPVRAIVPAGQAICRCLTIEDDHTFIANGVVVHNSTYASRKFIAWRMGRHPNEKIIGGGNSQRFVENEFSKRIRNLVSSQAYRDIFPTVFLDPSTRAADQWALANYGGQYVAKGVGQAVHGFRAHFICVDDPYAKIEAAESPTIREAVKTWFFGDLGSRLLPGGIIFLVMTRFHDEDLTGSVMEANKVLSPEARYRIIEAPAICYDPETDVLGRDLGEVLWEYYPLTYFADKKATWKYQRFLLVFQQLTDAVNEASIASHLQFYDFPPHITPEAIAKARAEGKIDQETGKVVTDKRNYYRRIVVSVDTATKDTARADYTVIQVWAETFDRKYYLLDQNRGKWQLPEMTREINKLARKHGADCILVEDKGNGSAYIQDQGATEFQRRKAPCPIVAIQVPSNQSKVFRFDEVSPMIEAHEVYVPSNAPWIDLFIRELGQFPDTAHDDQVDALSQFLRWVKTKRTRYGTRKVASMG